MPPKVRSFSGDISLISLFDLGQLLTLNRATGRLALVNGPQRAALLFEDGQLVNAIDDHHQEGELAAYQLFTWKQGAFEFYPEPASGTRLIQATTEAVMLEAARRLDETAGRDGSKAPSATEKLKAHQGRLEALRDAFTTVASEATDSAEKAKIAAGTPLDALNDADDRLIFRRGKPPRLCCGGQWFSASETPIDSREFDDLKRRLFENAERVNSPSGSENVAASAAAPQAPPTPSGSVSETRTARTQDGRTFAVTSLRTGADDSLWIRRIALAPPDPARLRGPLDQIQQLIDDGHAHIRIIGRTLAESTELLHAMLAWMLAHSPEAAVVIAEHASYRHADMGGAVAEVQPGDAAQALRALRPTVVAIEPSLAHDDEARSVIDGVGIVFEAHVRPVSGEATIDVPSRAIPRLTSAVSIERVANTKSEMDGALRFRILRPDEARRVAA
jgi:Domain of unknown function (DUF4388)